MGGVGILVLFLVLVEILEFLFLFMMMTAVCFLMENIVNHQSYSILTLEAIIKTGLTRQAHWCNHDKNIGVTNYFMVELQSWSNRWNLYMAPILA